MQRTLTQSATNIVISFLTLMYMGCEDGKQSVEEPNNSTPDGSSTSILVDMIHTKKQNPDLKLKRDNYDYQGMHGYYRLFNHLKSNGYPYRKITRESAKRGLTPELLKEYKILFINLVSDDCPDFTKDEIIAIDEYVSGGGGLFVIADHTNVYRHAERINSFLKPMGIEILYYTVLEPSTKYSIAGDAWIKIQHFREDHPISEDIKMTSFQTGGHIKAQAQDQLAWSSTEAYGDFWNEEDSSGYYGNWKKDPDEPTGSLPLAVASKHGKGRVVVVGDQNIFGDEWLFMANNFEWVCNIFEWLGSNETDTTHLRNRLSTQFFSVGFELNKTDWNIGKNSCDGFFPFFINFNRTPEIVARGILEVSENYDALVFTDPINEYSNKEIQVIKNHQKKGKPIIILTDLVTGGKGAYQLLNLFSPGIKFKVEKGKTFTTKDLPIAKEYLSEVSDEELFPAISNQLPVKGFKIASHRFSEDLTCPKGIDSAESFLQMIEVEGGEPLISADLKGNRTDIALILPGKDNLGDVIIIIQDGLFRNSTLGDERQTPSGTNLDVHHLQYEFLDWLVKEYK